MGYEKQFIQNVRPEEYDSLINECREFFKSKGFLNAYVQNRLYNMSACEDPNTITTFDYLGEVWAMKQTGQMDLEMEFFRNPTRGIYCETTSYRAEPNPVPGRHDLVFPMFEFEQPGDMEELIKTEEEFLRHLRFPEPYYRFTYQQLADKYGVKELTHEHEMQMYKDFGPVVFITDFPEHTDPFWNMRRSGNELAKKVDVIICGVETIGSAERSCDPEDMITRFNTIGDGKYRDRLYSSLGKCRVDSELSEFMQSNFTPRSGGGIGFTRLIKAKKETWHS